MKEDMSNGAAIEQTVSVIYCDVTNYEHRK